MKVVFLESVEGTAQVGEIKDVKSGFARNYLLPRGLAAPAVEPYLQRANARAVREQRVQDELDRDASTLAERLEGSHIEIIARVGEQGKLYGSVTAIHIAQEVAKLIGDEEFDHRKVLLPEAIKEVGLQPIRLRLTRNVEAAIELDVVAEGVDEDEVAEGEAAVAAVAEGATVVQAEDEATADGPAATDDVEDGGEPKAELAEAKDDVEDGGDEASDEEKAAEDDE